MFPTDGTGRGNPEAGREAGVEGVAVTRGGGQGVEPTRGVGALGLQPGPLPELFCPQGQEVPWNGITWPRGRGPCGQQPRAGT